MQTGTITSNGAGHEHSFGLIEATGGTIRFDAKEFDGDVAGLNYGQKVVFETEGGRAVRVRLSAR